MIACVDVDYRRTGVVAACVSLGDWADAAPAEEATTSSTTPPATYVPGQLYLRELPYLLDVLGALKTAPRIVVVDAYVWLGPSAPGIGARLFDALGGGTPVVGVAKTSYRGAVDAIDVRRGTSTHPLYVSAIGIEPTDAADAVRRMHGTYRIPTALKRVDRLSREAFPEIA
jgi:deoxyribonuclease V